MRSIRLQPLLLFAVLFFLFQNDAAAQSRFKLGVGGSLISNDGENPNFNSFLAPSIYFSYSFIRLQNFSVGVENTLSYRSSEDGFLDDERNGFGMNVPITMEYRLARLRVNAGAGPAYVRQWLVGEGNSTIDKVGGFYGDITGGLGLALKQNANHSVNLRFHYLKSFSSNYEDGGMLSLYLALGGK
jgi:hypothetical protein